MRVEFLPSATVDMREITFSLEMANPAAAERFLDRMDGLIARLERFPRMGKPVRRYGSEMRKLVVDSHLVFYRVDLHVEIIRVIHASRDLAAIFGKDDDQP